MFDLIVAVVVLVMSVLAMFFGFLVLYGLDLGIALMGVAAVLGIYGRIAQASYHQGKITRLLEKQN